jgi:hypothetical protein
MAYDVPCSEPLWSSDALPWEPRISPARGAQDFVRRCDVTSSGVYGRVANWISTSLLRQRLRARKPQAMTILSLLSEQQTCAVHSLAAVSEESEEVWQHIYQSVRELWRDWGRVAFRDFSVLCYAVPLGLALGTRRYRPRDNNSGRGTEARHSFVSCQSMFLCGGVGGCLMVYVC